MMDLVELARGVILTAYTGEPTAFAGCVLFARDGESIEEARACSERVRAVSGAEPIVAIDQEGGRVARLRRGVEAMPSMMALGATGDEGLALRAGEATAHDLRRAGCTVDFAPVLDLALEPANTVIGTRAFGSDPLLVARLGAAFARGLRSGGIIPTYKHVPGHGSTDVDSHLALPHVRTPEETLRARDFVPFARCASDDAAMMASHVVIEALDPDRPASISRRVLHGLLRETWGFTGVAFTDCLQMDAIARGVGTVEGACAAIAAGADCVIISQDVSLASSSALALADRVCDGSLSLERLREANARVMRLRLAGAPALPLDAPPPHPGLGREIARRAVTLVRGVARANPNDTVVVSFEGEAFDGAGGLATNPSLLTQAPGVHELRASLAPGEGEREALVAHVRAGRRRCVILARRAHLYPEQLRAIDVLLEIDPDALVISTREPFDVPKLSRARHLLATYGDDTASMSGLADVIFEEAPAEGTLPVRFHR